MRPASGFAVAVMLFIAWQLFGSRLTRWVFSRNDRFQAELDRRARCG